MPARTNCRPARQQPKSTRMEPLESRQFLSAAGDWLDSIVVRPHAQPLAANAEAAPFANPTAPTGGYTPQQIRHAYGFDSVSFNGVQGDGRRQTIAIVTAHDHPTIASDLQTFDRQFGLPDAPSFKKVSQTGGATGSITTDAGWAMETALDVQWAHAMAPAADLLLVEAASPTLGNLLSAVDYARRAPGVSVVSMSWGAGEFFGETSLDGYFTTPAGHSGVTFVAASGDDGSQVGASWPAASPNVLSVGGTTLHLADGAGGRAGEAGWGESGGGASRFEREPAYQARAQSTGLRTTPDVAYDADPATGFPVYSSIGFEGYTGWSLVGGTSAGAPQWGALVAVANQGRALNHLGSLDGRTGTLPMLYGLHDAGAPSYNGAFNDVVTGRSSSFMAAHGGYDGVTGLGTPKANAIAQALAQSAGAAAPAVVSGGADASAASARRHRRGARPAAQPATAAGVDAVARAIAGAAQVSRPALAAQHVTVPTATTPTAGADAVAVASAAAGRAMVGPADALAQGVHASLSPTLFSEARVTEADAHAANAAAAMDAARQAFSRLAAAAMPSAEVTAAQPLAGPAEGAIKTFAGALLPQQRRSFHFPRIDALAAFNDALAAFADETIAAVTGARPTGAAQSRRARAWLVTAGVAAADVALFAYWYATRNRDEDKEGRKQKQWEKPRHWITPGGPFPPGA